MIYAFAGLFVLTLLAMLLYLVCVIGMMGYRQAVVGFADFIRIAPIGPSTLPPGSFGGGVGPTGTTNSPGLAPGTGPSLTPQYRQYSVNSDHLFVLDSNNQVKRCQPIYVPENTLVAIRAHNGTTAGNSNIIRIARQPELLTGAGGDVLTPDTQISWPVDNLCQIFFTGPAAGDGIIISLQRGRA